MPRITSIRTHFLEHALDEPFGFSQWSYAKRHALLVEIEDASGVCGWGECYGPAAINQTAIHEFYAPLLIGWDPMRNEAAWHHCWRRSLDFARRGVMMGALSGLDMAFFDLKGKLLGLSASELMGGRLRETVPCYATGMYFRNLPEDRLLDALIEEAKAYRERGFSALKIKVGKNMAFDRRIIGAMRRAFPGMRLMADANHAYSLPEAIRIGHALDEHGYTWFEEPLSPQNPRAFRQLSDHLTIPIATGESEQTRWGFAELVAAGGVQIIQPDLAFCGGPTEALKIRALASAAGVNVIPHAWGTMLSLASAAHFLASCFVEPGRIEEDAPLLETDCSPNPLRDELCAVALDLSAGRVMVPTAPGLGVEPDRAAMGAFCIRKTEANGGK